MPIETADGLYEAVRDVVEEFGGRFTIAEMLERLPYGQRTREAVRTHVREGLLSRVGKGQYRRN